MSGAEQVSQFATFVAALTKLRGQRGARFQEFLEKAEKLVRPRMATISGELDRWVTRYLPESLEVDLFDVLGVAGKENRYTDALAWLLNPRHPSGERLARALVARVRPVERRRAPVGSFRGVRRELVTDDGRVDLVLEFEGILIVIETKVWSNEHNTPGGRPQTESYSESVGRHLQSQGLFAEVFCVLLTPEGVPPLNQKAGLLDFFDVGAAIAETGCADRSDEAARVARLVACHFLETATLARGGSFRKAVQAARNKASGGSTRDLESVAPLVGLERNAR